MAATVNLKGMLAHCWTYRPLRIYIRYVGQVFIRNYLQLNLKDDILNNIFSLGKILYYASFEINHLKLKLPCISF